MEATSAKPGRTQNCSGKTGATPPFGDSRRPVSRSRGRNSPMLPPPDADLVAREPDLPGLASVLDSDAFAEILRAQVPGVRIQGARATYMHYKPGTFCLVDYAVQADGHTVDAYGIAHRVDAAIKLRNAEEKGQVAGPFRVGRFVVEDLSLIVSFFPNDRRLRTLPALVDEKRRRRLFQKIFLEHPDMWEASVETIRYRPERRYSAARGGRATAGRLEGVRCGGLRDRSAGREGPAFGSSAAGSSANREIERSSCSRLRLAGRPAPRGGAPGRAPRGGGVRTRRSSARGAPCPGRLQAPGPQSGRRGGLVAACRRGSRRPVATPREACVGPRAFGRRRNPSRPRYPRPDPRRLPSRTRAPLGGGGAGRRLG